jgi:hypothetical protein
MPIKRLTASIATTLVVFLLLISASRPALADWALEGAQYSCNAAQHSFEVLPYEQTSSGDTDWPSQPGFVQVQEGHPLVSCKFGRYTVQAAIDVYPPGNGECEGAGEARARSLSISGVELLPTAPDLAPRCSGFDNSLTKLRLSISDTNVSLELCYQSSTNFGKHGCSTAPIPIESLAQQVNQTASSAAQAAQSATKLPPENDMAKVFAASGSSAATAPICAHSRIFQAALPTARIAGVPGDRIYIHPGNPQICDATAEPRCRTRAYLIPGDRVDVNFICGEWTSIRYQRTNAKSAIYGWVPTGRVYGVMPLLGPEPTHWTTFWTGRFQKDPLLAAIGRWDVQGLAQLVAQHDQRFDIPRALRTAIYSNDTRFVNALLPRAAEARADCSELMMAALEASADVLTAMSHAGFDLTCNKDALIQLAGYDRISNLFSNLSEWGTWTPLRELPARIHEVIAAGIPVDGGRASGKTALIAAVDANNVDVAQVLLTSGANPNVVVRPDGGKSSDWQGGETALIRAIELYGESLDPTMVHVLLDGGANPNYKTSGEYRHVPDDAQFDDLLAGVTALDVAAAEGDAPIVQLLLARGADPRIARSDGALPIDIAKSNHHEEIAALIAGYQTKH